MTLPPLYKYLDVQGAKLTFGNGTFRHSTPSDFNDIEDLTIQSIFPEETEVALKKLSDGFHDVIIRHLNDMPTCSSPMKEQIALLQYVYRNNPKAAGLVEAELSKKGDNQIYDVDHMRKRARETVQEINEFMQDYRVFCVTTHRDSEEMWSTYAEAHKGIVLRIQPNVAKDSKFQLFRPVAYRESRPPLFDDTIDFIADSLFGDQKARLTAMMEKIVYSKTLQWRHEDEYRFAIPLGVGERPWTTLKFHPEEVTELYLGRAMTDEGKKEIVSKALALNPEIKIFQAGSG